MFTIIECDNGFLRLTGEGATFYVQGMWNTVRRQLSGKWTPDDSRPTCTCREGHAPTWCAHKKEAAEYVRTIVQKDRAAIA